MSFMWPNIKEELKEEEVLPEEKEEPSVVVPKEEVSQEEVIPEDVQAYKTLDDVPQKDRKYYGI